MATLILDFSHTVPTYTAVPDPTYLEQLENIEKCLWCGLERPRQAIRHVDHDVDSALQTVVNRVHGLNVGAVQNR